MHKHVFHYTFILFFMMVSRRSLWQCPRKHIAPRLGDISLHLFKLSRGAFLCEQIPNIRCTPKSWVDVSSVRVHCTWRSQKYIQTLADSSAGYYGLASLHFRSYRPKLILDSGYVYFIPFCVWTNYCCQSGFSESRHQDITSHVRGLL